MLTTDTKSVAVGPPPDNSSTGHFFGSELAFSFYAGKQTVIGEVLVGSWREAAELLTRHQMIDMAAARAEHPHLARDEKNLETR